MDAKKLLDNLQGVIFERRIASGRGIVSLWVGPRSQKMRYKPREVEWFKALYAMANIVHSACPG